MSEAVSSNQQCSHSTNYLRDGQIACALCDLGAAQRLLAECEMLLTMYDRSAAWRDERIAMLAKLRAPMGSSVETKAEAGPFVVGDGGGHGEHRFRTLKQGFSAWTLDLDEALQFARRKDAELYAAEDEDAWVILPVGRVAVKTSGDVP